MKNNIFKLLLLTVIISLGACYSHTPPSANKLARLQEEIQGFELPKLPEAGKALVYIVRPAIGEGFAFSKVHYSVYVDSKEIPASVGYTQARQYIYFDLTPGTHTIYSKAENWAEKQVNVKAGDILYFQQDIRMGKWRHQNELVPLDEIEGKYRVKNLSMGTLR